MEELIDVLDKDGVKTGVIKKKSEVKRDGDFHRAISVCFVNDKKEILIHKRHSSKKIYPNLWSCYIKSHIVSSESSIDGAIRETKEEIGIDISKDQLQFLYTLYDNSSGKKDYINNIFYDNYIVFINIDLKDVVIQEDEVSDVKYINYHDLKSLIQNKDSTITPNWEEYNKLIEYLDNKWS